MTTIVIKPKTKEESDLLKKLLDKMNIESEVVEESAALYFTKQSISDVRKGKGSKVKNSKELFDNLGI